MTDPAGYRMRTPPTWARDLGTLRATADYLAAKGRRSGATPQEVAEWAGLDVVQMIEALETWERVQPAVIETYSTAESLIVSDLTERGRRLVGLWPSAEEVVDRLIAALDQAAEDEPDEAKKSKLHAAGVTLAGVARDIGVSVVAQTIGAL